MTAPVGLETGVGVRCDHLRHVYRLDDGEVVALDDVDITVHAGESVGILGASGSGKSTLLTLLAGLLRPTAGHLYIGADDVAGMNERDLLRLRGQRIGVVLQNPARNLLPYGTGIDNVAFAQRAAYGYRRGQLPEPADLLGRLGLATLGEQRVSRMSGGEQQRLSVAVGMSAGPGLLLADEPTSQLDGANRDRVVELLGRVGAEFGSTVVVVTHDPEVAGALGRTVTIHEGRADDGAQVLEQFSTIGADGSVLLPADVQRRLPPGSRVRVVRKASGVELIRSDEP
ncbi:MAG: ATP-binding cassette domain-containing protein [Actinobacteria bacterium]|nr:ATP-binding cassette domain-containing protein [Actinomycetota bacterium]